MHEFVNEWIELSMIFNSRERSLLICNMIEEKYHKLIGSKKPLSSIGPKDHEALALNMAFLSGVHAIIALTRKQLFKLRNSRTVLSKTERRPFLDVTYDEVLRHYANSRRHSYSVFIDDIEKEIMLAAWRSIFFIRLLNPDYARKMDEGWSSSHPFCPPDPNFELESLYRVTATAQAMIEYFSQVRAGRRPVLAKSCVSAPKEIG